MRMMQSLRRLETILYLLCICFANGSRRPGRGSVVVAGATGYIGRTVVRELVSRNIDTYALVRSTESISNITLTYLEGAKITQCDVLNPVDVAATMSSIGHVNSLICCLASRNGLGADSFNVDYGGGSNLLHAVLRNSRERNENILHEPLQPCHYVLLSAYCCGKPELQFQYAKLKLEEEIRQHTGPLLSHSIVRPTAYFKSLDGQVEAARKGNPILYFGSGTCSANAISEEDLAEFLVDSALQAEEVDMLDSTRNIGGPDVPPVTKLQQIELIFDALDIPKEKRNAIAIPVGIFQVLISIFGSFENISRRLGLSEVSRKCMDAAEIIRIVRYYATEPMVALGPGEVQGRIRLRDHFCNIAGRGGCLVEIDQYTTTTGVLDMVLKNDYVK
jgi:divinyl chlorophyllide a 8-vinyl-reductase